MKALRPGMHSQGALNKDRRDVMMSPVGRTNGMLFVLDPFCSENIPVRERETCSDSVYRVRSST